MRDSVVSDDAVPTPENDPAFQLLWRLLPVIGWEHWATPNTIDNWRQALRSVNVDSAPGVDGLSHSTS